MPRVIIVCAVVANGHAQGRVGGFWREAPNDVALAAVLHEHSTKIENDGVYLASGSCRHVTILADAEAIAELAAMR